MVSTGSGGSSSTAERSLDVAERLVQVRGYNGFSYADVAGELEITTATLHYHFRGKAELGAALIARYSERFSDALTAIDHDLHDARAKLEAYAELYAGVLRSKRMCLCGILAAEYETLPEAMRQAVTRFFIDNETWLTAVLTQGQRDGTLSIVGSTQDAARTILSGLEGAILVARTHGGLSGFEASASRLLAAVTAY
jgi:TetR/AcrR family transcriptional repressor of nem operon